MYKYEIDLLNMGLWSPQIAKIYLFFYHEVKDLKGIEFNYDINGLILKAIILSENINDNNYMDMLEKISKNGLFRYIETFELINNCGGIYSFNFNNICNYGLIYNNIIQQQYKDIKDSCLIKGCKNIPQKCHTISRFYLKNISFKGNVLGYDQNLRIFSKDKIKKIELKKIGLNDASTKKMYCNDHDKIYTIFEKEEGLINFLDEAILLLHHRVINAMKYDIFQKVLIINKSNEQRKYITNEVLKNYENGDIFAKKINSSIPSEVISLIVKFDKMNISFTGLYFDLQLDYLCEFLKNGKILKNKEINILSRPFFTVNCFSDENNSYLILSSEYVEHFKIIFENIVDHFKLENRFFIENFILFLAVIGGNFYFNPLWVENCKCKDLLDSLVNYLTFGLIRSEDINNFVDFTLINKNESLDLIFYNKKEYEIKIVSKDVLYDHIKKNIEHK